MSREYKLFIKNILDAIDDIGEFVGEMEFSDFLDDKKTKRAVVQGIEVIGEASKNIPNEIISKYKDVPWKEMVKMRDKIAHFYFGKEYLLTEQLYQSSLRTPGEARPANKSVLEKGIAEGVNKGIFGIGELEGDKVICYYFKEPASVAFSDNEALINDEICREQKKTEERSALPEPTTELKPDVTGEGFRENLLFRFIVPKGKISDIMQVMNFLQTKFNTLEVELIATEGKISNQEIEDKIREAFRQLGIEIDLEN